jgi:predicted permease
MIAFALLSLPVFGVVALGWGAASMRLAPLAMLDALAAFSFRFALPALVFRLMLSQPLGRLFNPVFYGGYLASAAVIFALVLGLSLVVERHATATIAGAYATTATVSNLGFLGPPLMLAFFGERGAGPLAMAFLAEILVLMSLGSVLMAAARGGAYRAILRGAVLNPVLIAILFGVGGAVAGIELPSALDRFVGFLGGSAGPAALFSLGGVLALRSFDRGAVLTAANITAAKLVAYPALVWYVLAHVLQAGQFWVEAGVLAASLPPAANIYVLAQRYDAEADCVSMAISLATLASVATVPLAAWLVIR